jgi:hypothetical protein
MLVFYIILRTFTLIRCDSAVSKNIRYNHLQCFRFADTFLSATQKHETGITFPHTLQAAPVSQRGLPLPHARSKTCMALALLIGSCIGFRKTVNENVLRSVCMFASHCNDGPRIMPFPPTQLTCLVNWACRAILAPRPNEHHQRTHP